MSVLRKALIFFRLIDQDHGQLSLTDIAMYVVLVKLALVQQASVADLGAFFGVLAARSYRRYLTTDSNDSTIH